LTESPGFLLTVLAFLLVLGPLVFIHELGHYLAGRWFGVKAETFSVGFGREIAGFTDRRGTRWQFGWMPLGGYVRFAGDMNPASQPDAEWLSLPRKEREQTFQAKPVWQRAIIVASGPAINFALAILILAGFAYAYGVSRTPTDIASVRPDSAAAAAGLAAGDRIVALNGRAVATFDDMQSFVRIRAGEPVRIAFERNGERRETVATLGTAFERDRFGNEYRLGLLGVERGEAIREPVSLIEAPVEGVRRTGEIVVIMVETLGQIVTGRRSVEELGGPLKIAQVSGQQLTLGAQQFVALIALISINLGFINLLPIPMLDGGHLLFYAIEAIRRRPIGPKAAEWAYRGGLAAVLALMVFVTMNDLGSFGLWQGLAGLIG
jgi:regulator of sigma E protease